VRSCLKACVVALTVSLTAVGVAPAASATAASARPKDECNTTPACYVAAFSSYVVGLPLVMEDRSAQIATNVASVSPPGSPNGRAPMNQFTVNTVPNASFTDIVLPSVSTPYSNAFLDLSEGPWVLTIPDIASNPIPGVDSRFFLFQVLDAWTNVGGESDSCVQGKDGFCGLGTRYGTQAGNYLFARAGWKGTVPAGIKQVIYVNSNLAWIAGRTLTNGTTDDLNTVTQLQLQYKLTPLRRFGKPYTPPTNVPIDPRLDMTTPAVTQVENMDAKTYFETLARNMIANPPSAADAAAVKVMAQIGLVPGKPFVWAKLNVIQRAAVELAYKQARQFVVSASQVSPPGSSWIMGLHDGSWPATVAGYLQRAIVSYGGLGANLYKDAVYAGTLEDANGQPLAGPTCYRLSFPTPPPANPAAFWSVTLYNRPGENLFAAPIARNGVGIPGTQGNDLVVNADGSLDIYIQPNAPASGVGSKAYHNWLPSPSNGGFLLLLRIYWPSQALFDKTWVPPAVQSAPCQ
jgi:hypothetical protein